MCLICAGLVTDKLTTSEARKNLGEMREQIDKEHRLEVLKMIWKKEDEEDIYFIEDDKYGDTD
tara:strand:+ start:963 stop:1151 length:189 start_codon:yes stop_codon:yes gene_type:complete